jgi:hypothetical protein
MDDHTLFDLDAMAVIQPNKETNSQSTPQVHTAHGMQVILEILRLKSYCCSIGTVGPLCGQQQSASINMQQPPQTDTSFLVNSQQQSVSSDLTNGN